MELRSEEIEGPKPFKEEEEEVKEEEETRLNVIRIGSGRTDM